MGETIRSSGGRARRGPPLDRLSADDVEILRREAGHIRGHTCKVLVLEPTAQGALPTVGSLRAAIAARLDAAPRMRQRLVYTPLHVAAPVWLDDPDFDVARHVKAVPSGGPVSYSRLQSIVAELMAERLDPARPLWQLQVVERLDDGSMALIWRIHHCMADGTTCVRLGAGMLWSDSPDAPPPPATAWVPEPAPSGISLLVQGLAARARPRRPGSRSQTSTQSLRASMATIRRELSPAAGTTEFAVRSSVRRRVAFAGVPLADCKRAGKAIDAAVTLNDVVLALVTGGVHAWLCHRHGALEGIRAKVPVSLHRADDDAGLANRDSYFFVDLPVGEEDPVERVRAINRETRQRKLEHDAETLYRLGTHPFVTRWAMSPHVFTFNVSNVPGPRTDVYILGSRVRELYSLAEIAPGHGLRVAVISAAGSLFFGLCADRDAVPDLDLLARGIERSADELLAVAR